MCYVQRFEGARLRRAHSFQAEENRTVRLGMRLKCIVVAYSTLFLVLLEIAGYGYFITLSSLPPTLSVTEEPQPWGPIENLLLHYFSV